MHKWCGARGCQPSLSPGGELQNSSTPQEKNEENSSHGTWQGLGPAFWPFWRPSAPRKSPRKRRRRRRKSGGRWGNAVRIVWSKWTKPIKLSPSWSTEHCAALKTSWSFGHLWCKTEKTPWKTWEELGLMETPKLNHPGNVTRNMLKLLTPGETQLSRPWGELLRRVTKSGTGLKGCHFREPGLVWQNQQHQATCAENTAMEGHISI